MVAVVDKKNKKKYKAIKVEEQEDVKSRKYNQSSTSQVQGSPIFIFKKNLFISGIKHGVMVHACYDCLESQIYVSERIRAFYESRKVRLCPY